MDDAGQKADWTRGATNNPVVNAVSYDEHGGTMKAVFELANCCKPTLSNF